MYLNVPPTYASVQVIRLRDKIFSISKEDDTKRGFVSHLASLLNVFYSSHSKQTQIKKERNWDVLALRSNVYRGFGSKMCVNAKCGRRIDHSAVCSLFGMLLFWKEITFQKKTTCTDRDKHGWVAKFKSVGNELVSIQKLWQVL